MSTIEASAVSAAAKVSLHARRRLVAGGLRAAEAVVQRLALGDGVDFWLRELDPVLSLTEGRARVVDVIDETHDVKTFVLAPNLAWFAGKTKEAAYRAGQFVTVGVDVDGVRTSRCYSLSSAPGASHVTITVKRAPGGLVSAWMHAKLAPGDVVRLGPPAGEFVVAEASAPKLLLLSGGSGITPVMSILRDLVARGTLADVVFVHAARTRADVIFGRELRAMAERHPALRLAILTEDVEGRLDAAKLVAAVPDLDARAAWMCGPPAMMTALAPVWDAPSRRGLLRTERFAAAPPLAPPSSAAPMRVKLALLASRRTVSAEGAGSLLEQLERGGLSPAHGCRMGICNTCRCVKRSGVVEDMRTGARSSAPDEEIRLCVSRARSDVELAL